MGQEGIIFTIADKHPANAYISGAENPQWEHKGFRTNERQLFTLEYISISELMKDFRNPQFCFPASFMSLLMFFRCTSSAFSHNCILGQNSGIFHKYSVKNYCMMGGSTSPVRTG